MSNLNSAISDVPVGQIAFYNKNETVSYGQIFEFIKDNKVNIDQLNGLNVVIIGQSRLDIAKLLFLLDSKVSSILLLPPDIDKNLHNQYFREANIHVEVYLKENKLCFNKINEPQKKVANETAWIIPTSGTTNSPKLVSHNFKSLTKTTKINKAYGSKNRWGLVFDIYRFSGLQVYLQAILSGSSLIITDPSDSISDIISNLQQNKCNALSATPSFWRKMMMTKKVNNLKLEIVTLGGEIADASILLKLKNLYPEAKISHIYASTEAGVGFSVSDCKPGFPKSYLETGINDVILKISKTNTLLIKQDNASQKYLSEKDMFDKNGFIDTGDVIEVHKDRVLFLGRDSGAINVGGNKVQPEEVELVLLNSKMIQAAYVYAKKNPIMGNIVFAEVIPNDNNQDTNELKGKLMSICKDNLEQFKIPGIIKCVNSLSINYSGKLKRGPI